MTYELHANLISIPVAARMLELSENQVKYLAKQGVLEVGGSGAWGRQLLEIDSVHAYAITQGLGKLGRRERTINIVGDVDKAVTDTLTVVGVHLETHERLLPVLADTRDGVPPIIITTPSCVVAAMSKLQELDMVSEINVYARVMIATTRLHEIPWVIEQRSVVMPPESARQIALWAWSMLKERQMLRKLRIEQI